MATTLGVGMALPMVRLQREDGGDQLLPDPAGPNLLVFYRGDW